MKFNLKKLEKSAVIGLASVALVLPMAMRSGQTQVHAESLRYYEECLDNAAFDLRYSSPEEQMRLMIDHPALKHTAAARGYFEDASESIDGYGWDYLAKHYAQLYSPYLKSVMPKYAESEGEYNAKDTRIIQQARRRLGLSTFKSARKPARRHFNARRHHVIRHRVRKPRVHYHKGRQAMKRNQAKKQLINRINRTKAQVRKDQRMMKRSRRRSAKRNYSKAINRLNASIKKMNRQLRRMK